MSSQWIAPLSGLGGALIGAGATLATQWLAFRREKGSQRLTAEMQMASQIRLWLTETKHILSEHEVDESCNPSDDPNDVTRASIPSFPFENSLSVVSLLPTKLAQDAFELIERKMSAEKAADFISRVETSENGAERFNADIAGIVIDAASLCDRLTTQIGWTGSALTSEEVEYWRKRAVIGS